MRNHNPVARFYTLAPTRTRAIEAKCPECMGCTKNHLKEGFKKGIRNWTAPHCPLHTQVLLRFKLGEALNGGTYSGARA